MLNVRKITKWKVNKIYIARSPVIIFFLCLSCVVGFLWVIITILFNEFLNRIQFLFFSSLVVVAVVAVLLHHVLLWLLNIRKRVGCYIIILFFSKSFKIVTCENNSYACLLQLIWSFFPVLRFPPTVSAVAQCIS